MVLACLLWVSLGCGYFAACWPGLFRSLLGVAFLLPVARGSLASICHEVSALLLPFAFGFLPFARRLFPAIFLSGVSYPEIDLVSIAAIWPHRCAVCYLFPA
jgi:hypothetical protein